MKTGLLLFCGGLILGLAGGLLLRPGDGENPNAENETAGGHGRGRWTAPAAGSPSKSTRTHRARTGRTGSPRSGSGNLTTDFLAFMGSLSDVDDLEDLNMVEFVRQASALTYLSEGQAHDLLVALTKPPEEGEEHDQGDLRQIASALVFARLCEVNGPEAMRMAAAGELGDQWKNDRDELVAMGMNSWVAADPQGAQQWFEGLLGETDKLALAGLEEDMTGSMALLGDDEIRQAYFNGMAKHDAKGLEQRMGQFQHEEVRSTMEGEVLEALVRQEHSKAGLIALLDRSGDGAFDAREEALKKLGKQDPRSAAKWVEDQPVSNARDNHVTQVAMDFMTKDPDAGVDWYMKQELHDESREGDRTSHVVGRLVQVDYGKAVNWLEDQPDGPARDSAEVKLAHSAAGQQNWGDSMAWIAGIESEGTRRQALDRVLRRGWDSQDKALRPEVLEAAEAAGLGEAAQGYKR